ncbi:MAG: amidohydrolase family protein, partial [Candidatus Thorarchaeota archaeon]|jgi:cytosine/adenosine deaminase-related metal-dependent hydrolase
MLVKGKWIITNSGKNRRALKNGAIIIENDIISAIGDYDEISRDYSFDVELGSDKHAIIPGLVNAHNHGRGLSAFQGGVADAPLELWLPALFNSYETDLYWDTLLAAMDMISRGITSVLCHWCERDPSAESYRDDLEKSVKAFLKSGMRVAIAPVIYDQNRYAYLEEEKILSKLPGQMKYRLESRDEDPSRIKNYFDTINHFRKKYSNRSERIKFQYGPNGVQWCSDALLREVEMNKKRNGMRVHLHLLETKYQKKYGDLHFGKSVVQHLKEIGLLDAQVSFAHCVWVNREDIELFSESKSICIHNPSSNLRLHSGIAPITAMLDNGVDLALGTDSTGINDDDDLIQEMRLAWLLQRMPGLNSRYVSSSEVFDLATLGSAKAAGFSESIGSIEIGKKADLVLLDIRKAISPIRNPTIPILDFLLQRITKSDVDIVVIDGKKVFENGRSCDLNRAEVVEELKKSLVEPSKEDLEFASQLKKLLLEFYSEWDSDELRHRYNLMQD